MSVTRLIVLCNQPLHKLNVKRFGLNINSKNFVKEYWCILPLVNSKVAKKYLLNEFRISKNRNFFVIYSYKDLIKKIKNLKRGFFYLNFVQDSFSNLLEVIFKIKGGIKISLLQSYEYTKSRNLLEKLLHLYRLNKFFAFKMFFIHLNREFRRYFINLFEVKF